jgi:hypothetical protein
MAATNVKLDMDPANMDKFVNDVLQVYATTGFKISVQQNQSMNNIIQSLQISPFTTYEFDEVKANLSESGDFFIYDSAVLALFEPTTASGTLYFDYAKMLEGDGVQFFYEFHSSICDALRLSKESGKTFSEADIKEIIPLDYPQKKAARMAINNSIVIQGPPGTGKSQTISNIIANFISLCRSSLFVTEKRTAANVVYNRLNKLRGYCLKFYEVDSDAIDFTRQVRLGLSRIRDLYGISAINDEVSITSASSHQLDEIFGKIEKFKNAMKNDDGRKFPLFVKKYIEQKEQLHAGLELIKPIVQTFSTGKDF